MAYLFHELMTHDTSLPQDMFWGAKFGALTDAYGVRWMFNCPLATA